MTDPTIWNQLLIWPILNLLIAFYKLFESLHIPGPLGFAIITLTIVIRAVLWPFMAAQLSSAKKIQRLKPHLDELNKKHKDDKLALQKAQTELYKQHGVNPAAGCLPTLLQMPILLALYRVFLLILQLDTSVAGAATTAPSLINDINKVLYFPGLHLTTFDPSFFGFNLAIKPSQWQQFGIWLFIIPVITGALQWVQTHLMLKQQPQQAIKEVEKKKNDKDKESSPEDMAQEISKQMGLITPIIFGFFAYQFPIGLALYWNVFGIFGIIQQHLINKRYG